MEPGAKLGTTLEIDLIMHLARLTAWSFASLFIGLMILIRDRKSGFAAMTTGWAAVNLAIVWFSLKSEPPTDPAAFRQFLGLNLMLNCVWIVIGLAMALIRRNPWVMGAGRAMVIQGVALQILDGVLYRLLPL